MQHFNLKPTRPAFFSERERIATGQVWQKAVLSLKDGDADISDAMQTLNRLSERYRVPSLRFASLQLQHFKRFGIAALNIGGTMGCGKSNLAKGIARVTGWEFKDADYFHSESNLEKMRAGKGLNDSDRYQFLSDVKNFLEQDRRISTCSALASRYRAILAGQNPDILLNKSTEQRNDPWEIANPRLGLLQIVVIKPYQRALQELDDSEKGRSAPRVHAEKKHFIEVTQESEARERAAGRQGILAQQYASFESGYKDPWTYLAVDTQLYSDRAHHYKSDDMIALFQGLPFIKAKV